ncbi:MAG: multiphosphoryl transfer protein [Actinomycetota bacterium]|jgi:phosphotransferase system enzyme I (PtsI)|nr:multiphosphoryl transfer protein [Actinomycetota bacterium]
MRLGDEQAAIFEVQAALIEDPEWRDPIFGQVARGVRPEVAVAESTDALAAEIRAIPDEYLQQRAIDILDLGQRVLRLLGPGEVASLADLLDGPDVIVAAHDLTPSETLALEPGVVKAIVTEGGGRTSHTAILARQLGIPAVVGIPGLLATVRNGLVVAVDGDEGYCDLEPTGDIARRFSAAAPARDRPLLHAPVRTSDGVEVHVLANAATPNDVRRAIDAGADGIGLYRTEFLFAGDELPDEKVQESIYCEAAAAASGRPITFRTLDVGGDKDAPLLELEQELNPFLGVRGVRFSLARPELFSSQLRALTRTAVRYPNVRVMVPMLTVLEELDLVRDLAPDATFPLGAMVEVPAAAILASELAKTADFLSVGTNDLTQYVLAVDRTNERLSSLYDELNPAVVRLLGSIAAAAAATGTEAGVCGELAGRPLAAPLLLGLGYRHLSVVPPQVQNVKRAITACTLASAEVLAGQALRATRTVHVAQLLQPT